MGGWRTEVYGKQNQSNDPRNNEYNLNTPTTGRCCRASGTPCHIQHTNHGLRERGNDSSGLSTPATGLRKRTNDTSKLTGRSGQHKAAT